MIFFNTNTEMMTLIGCLEKFGRDQSMCVDEINKFNRCYVKFQQTQSEERLKKEKGILPLGPQAKFNGIQMTDYFKKFPFSGRSKQVYFHPEFRPKMTNNK